LKEQILVKLSLFRPLVGNCLFQGFVYVRKVRALVKLHGRVYGAPSREIGVRIVQLIAPVTLDGGELPGVLLRHHTEGGQGRFKDALECAIIEATNAVQLKFRFDLVMNRVLCHFNATVTFGAGVASIDHLFGLPEHRLDDTQEDVRGWRLIESEAFGDLNAYPGE
jgi:hypothetical protein